MSGLILTHTFLSVYLNSLFDGDLTLLVILLSETVQVIQSLWSLGYQFKKHNYHQNIQCYRELLISVAGFCASSFFDSYGDFFTWLIPYELQLEVERQITHNDVIYQSVLHCKHAFARIRKLSYVTLFKSQKRFSL